MRNVKYSTKMKYGVPPCPSKPVFTLDWDAIRPRWWENEMVGFFIVIFGAVAGMITLLGGLTLVAVYLTNL